ncbi:MAG: Maf family protein [Lachnospiraceae bacterium]|nr:Maf family protein [Lachnospiraceae bacterium]
MTVKELNDNYKIILASASPRRKQILELVGLEFDVWPSCAEENTSETDPEKLCTSLSGAKAIDVAAQIRAYNDTHRELTTPGDIIVIGADTVVACNGEVFGKPRDEADAVRMLKALSGRTHSVYTGVSFVFISSGGRAGEYTFFEETKVSFYPLDEQEIEYYMSSYDVYDKAGSYGIQDGSAAFVRSIEGDYYNVVGLPVSRLLHELKRILQV